MLPLRLGACEGEKHPIVMLLLRFYRVIRLPAARGCVSGAAECAGMAGTEQRKRYRGMAGNLTFTLWLSQTAFFNYQKLLS